MSKARIPIVGIAHKVVLPGSTHRISISNYPECNFHLVSRGKKLTMFGVVTYRDPEKRLMYNYGTIVGIASEIPITRSESLLSGFFTGGFNSFPRHDWQLVIIGVERFKILSVSEDSGVTYASIKVENDTDTNITEKLVEDLRNCGKNHLKTLNLNEFTLNE